MLYKLTSSLGGFKTATFEPGLNIALAERTKKAQSKDSRNAVGKSSFVRVLDFLLGAEARPNHILRRPELDDAVFTLSMGLGGRDVNVSRSGAQHGSLTVDGEPYKLAQWRELLGRELFHLPKSMKEPSYRSLIAFYLRNVADGAFIRPTETHSKQSSLVTLPALTYLFGLDVELVTQVKELAVAERSLRDLKKAARDPVLGMTLGKTKDLDAQIATLQVQSQNLARELSSFQVVDRYTEHRSRADELSRAIRRLNDDIVLAERRLRDIDEAIAQEGREQPDHAYLQTAYEQVGLVLGDSVTRRFEEVAAFHESVVSNRYRYLEAEREQVSQDVTTHRETLRRLDAERAELMRLLAAGGALETFNELQRQAAFVDGRLIELRERRATVERWENSSKHLDLRSAELALQFSTDLEERREQREQIAQMFAEFALRLYRAQRPAALTIDSAKSGYTFTPTLGGDGSEGVRSMALFCFDLTMAVLAHRANRGPDFLVHDSHLYDGVEARQVIGALELAAEVMREEGMQYIVTMNSDDLQKALLERPGLEFNQCATMTDEYDEGGLFGIRFN